MEFYDKQGQQTERSRSFGREIESAIKPIIDIYVRTHKVSIRDLSHEAQSIVGDIELEYLLGW